MSELVSGGVGTEDTAQREIRFPEGLVGCEQWKRFVLVGDAPEEPVLLLQSLDEPEIAFWVTDPYHVLPDYEFQLSDADSALLELEDLAHLVVFVILTVRDTGVTANLVGPLVINSRTRLGKQLVLADSPYSVRHPVAAEASESAAEPGAARAELRTGS